MIEERPVKQPTSTIRAFLLRPASIRNLGIKATDLPPRVLHPDHQYKQETHKASCRAI